jgi:PIN domain nuclease of toxin-antitoxin system
MDLLIDTQALIWYVTNNPLLSPNAKNLIEDNLNTRTASIGSFWEITIKVNLNKLNLPKSLEGFLMQYSQSQISLLEITLEHISEVSKLPQHHRDPFDRLLIAQAITENLVIISTDVVFDSYNVTRIW